MTAHIVRRRLRVLPGAPSGGGGAWAPTYDGSGNITNYADLPARTWTAIPGTAMETTVKPILDAGGYTLYTYGSNDLGAVMDNYNGMAFDPAAGKMWAHGGGHEGGSDNGTYQIDLNKMTWSITAYPSHPSAGSPTGLTAEQSTMYGLGTGRSGDVNGTTSPHVYPLAASSTGFAIKYHSSFTNLQWWAVTGPERDVTPASVVFTNGDTWSLAENHALELPFASPLDDVLFDGRPASRHVYGGFLHSPITGVLLSVVRSYWKCLLDGSGWVKFQNGGGVAPEMVSGELIWAHVDEVTGKIWWGGCGSNCYNYGYHFYRAGVILDPSDMTDTPSPLVTPDGISTALCNAGDLQFVGFKAGRKIGGWCTTLYGWTYNLDTGARQLLYMTGTPYSGATGEGRSSIYMPHTGKEWIFDTSVQSLPAWSLDIDNPQAGGPNSSLTVATQTEALTNAAALPSNVNGLVYNRLVFWPTHKLIVYFPHTQQNCWVCRIP